jgi:hypothetical protein
MATTGLNRLGLDLAPLRRNNFYYGKLMDVLHTQMEQDYGILARRLINRHVFGRGVVCGLRVTSTGNVDKPMLLVTAGLAIDGWGREIIVPHDVMLSPAQLTDDCGCGPTATVATPSDSSEAPPTETKVVSRARPRKAIVEAPTLPPPPPEFRTISICYKECPSDFQPALVSDPSCDRGQRCEAGTVLESYCLRVTAGPTPPIWDVCQDNVRHLIATGQVHRALCLLAETCSAEPTDPCVTLAEAVLDPKKQVWIVDDCDFRTLVPTNAELFQLMTCLAQIVEECCKGTKPTVGPSKPPVTVAPTKPPVTDAPSKPPVTIAPSKPPVDMPDFRVRAVRIMRSQVLISELLNPREKWSKPVRIEDRADAVEFEFEHAVVDSASVTFQGSFEVTGPDAAGDVVVNPATNTVRWSKKAPNPSVKPQSQTLLPGDYVIRLISDLNAPAKSIRSLPAPTVSVLLDGDPTNLPSGNGGEGGTFECAFRVF